MKKNIYEITVDEFNNFDTRKIFFSIIFLIFLIIFIWFLDILKNDIPIEDLKANIFGGTAVVFIFSYIVPFIMSLHKTAAFKALFGNNVLKDFFIFYGNLNLRLDLFVREGEKYEPVFVRDRGYLRINKFPLTKYRTPSSIFKVPELASSGELRATNYFLKVFEENIKHAPTISSDEKNEDRCDISFISLGGLNNLRTIKVLTENSFYEFSSDEAIIQKQNKEKRFCIQDDENGNHKYDHGFIIKILPKNYPNQVWIAIAGIGEWGTSGAAWFLAKKWRDLPMEKSFGAIIRVEINKDESGELAELLEL